MTDNKMKVLYIAGWGRSGSTILARILGEIEGFFHGGELRTIWVDGLKPNGTCGCGKLVLECEIWEAILTEGFGGMEQINPKELNLLRHNSEPRTQEVILAQFLPSLRAKLQSRLKEYQQVLSNLYTAIAQVNNAQVIVDDSLHPGYAYTLSTMPNIDLYTIHLIRDPRATAYSWNKRQKKGLGTYSIRDNSLGWNLRNIAIESLQHQNKDKFLRIYYEEFATSPRSIIEKILHLLHESPGTLPFQSENEVELSVSHTVFGNPIRSQTGTTQIKLDNAWKEQLDRSNKLAVNLLTFPLLLRYHYLKP